MNAQGFMHPRNIHINGYNFKALLQVEPALATWLRQNPSGQPTIDFSNPVAVKMLNVALLKAHYGLTQWDIPQGYLCPPVPGRADYVHFIADLLAEGDSGNIPRGSDIVGLDIGTGANLIYPIVGSHAYGWRFVASDIDKSAVASAQLIAKSNPKLNALVSIRPQSQSEHIFQGVVATHEKITFTMCNPPFHRSAKDALAGSVRKNNNLHRAKSRQQRSSSKPIRQLNKKEQNALNFAGQNNELWCKGGEVGFIKRMVKESIKFKQQVGWFTSLVSKKESLGPVYKTLDEAKITDLKTVPMGQGNKVSRFVAWRY